MKEENQDTQDLLDGIDKFCEAMKDRIREKSMSGHKGWKECTPERASYEASQRIQRLRKNSEVSCDISIANWMAIHWLNRIKDES